MANLRHRRLVATLERDFEGHLLWHLHRHGSVADAKYYFLSAVTVMLPEFDYDFEVYQDAAKQHLEKARRREGSEADRFYVLSLDEFVQVLEFRERELQRIIKMWSSGGWKDDRAPEWEWPSEWGDLGWNGPILRERAHLWGAEEDLIRTRAALEYYRPRLLAQRRHVQ